MKDFLSYVYGALGGIGLFLLGWVRFRKKDVANVEKIKADSGKVNAEAQEIRAKADVLITDGALRIVERLSKDLDEAKDEIEKLILIVAELKALHEKHKVESQREADELHDKLREARDLVETKKRHCFLIKERVTRLQDLLRLKQTGLTQDQLAEFIEKLNEIKNIE